MRSTSIGSNGYLRASAATRNSRLLAGENVRSAIISQVNKGCRNNQALNNKAMVRSGQYVLIRSSGVTDARVEVRIKDVHQQITDYVESCKKQDYRLHHRKVAAESGTQNKLAHARPGKYRLGSYGPDQ